MKTKEFLQVAEKLTESKIYYNLKKGEHGKFMLGWQIFGSTESHYRLIWRKFGTLYNMVILKTAEETTEILKQFGINDFKAISTKSKRFCRLHNNF